MSTRDVELWVAKDAPVADVMEWAVLTIYAEQADEDGCNAFRSHGTVAKTTRMSVDCVKDRVQDLEARGILRRGDQTAAAYLPAYSRPVVYDIMIPYSWFGTRLDRINRVRAEKGRPPLTPEMRPELPPPPDKKNRRDAGMSRDEWRRKKAEQAAEQSDPGASSEGGASSTRVDDGVVSTDSTQGLQAPGGSDLPEGGATSPTTKPQSQNKPNPLGVAADADDAGALFPDPSPGLIRPGRKPKKDPDPIVILAQGVCRPWWDALPVKSSDRRAFPNVVELIANDLRVGRTEAEAAAALQACGVAVTRRALDFHYEQIARRRDSRPIEGPRPGTGMYDRKLGQP
jgi:hypothetical protein